MKSFKQCLPILMLIIGYSNFAQTHEQENTNNKTSKTRDSIIQCITLVEMLQQANEQEKRLEVDKKSKNNKISPITKAANNNKSNPETLVQNSITGTISNYKDGEGLITSFDMITREPTVLGTIDKDGRFNIPLDENYLTSIKEKAKNAQEKASNGWQIQFKTVVTTFGCDFNNESIEYLDDGTEKITYTGSTNKNEIIHENGEAIVTGIPDPNLTDKDGNVHSVLYAVNQPEIAKWLYSYGQDNAVKGYYLQWFFVENEATAKGACVVPTYTGIREENYNQVTITNLILQKGWNIIKYTITEVFRDANDKTTPSKMEITSIAELPVDILWTSIIIE